mgnify:CR=1 FL=1
MKNLLISTFLIAIFSSAGFTADKEGIVVKNTDRDTYFYSCKYVKADGLKKVLEELVSPVGRVVYSEELNMLVVSDVRENIPAIKEYIKNLDIYIPQVLVEAKIVELTTDSDFEYEIAHSFTSGSDTSVLQDKTKLNLPTPGANPNTNAGGIFSLRTYTNNANMLDNYLRVLVTNGKAKILSAPNLVVDKGTEASIITGEEVPVQSATVVSGSVSTTTQFKKVGVKLRVVPINITEDSVKLEINPEVSTVTGYTNSGSSGVSNPIVALRNTNTVLTVKDGEMITICGLMRKESRDVVKQIPILGDIPLIGLLFRSVREQTVNTQLMFFLKIKILKEGIVDGVQIFRPDEKQKEIDKEIEDIEKKIKE